ncbi:hypothetical protein NLB65_00050 [Candidatus Aminicenantes bacterium AC-335-B20]|jgi:hypothetical protein|nr:hypothetical protein [SCandidatus Aminicenantes bacterium Aminicenantia_JdfR_composite]MCP2596444.1 hypothetical protein [Candidatus Aminicenantes bacterium AC-335-G13]MCP2598837.1 hypothetical protein [Candidatus Aminicenantes bacterium AC-335-B20]MCP2620908.1 hypothetical protein [Candidatus Aminicenantes bacterium AC-334-E05]
MRVFLTHEIPDTLNLLRKINLKIKGILIGHLRGNGIVVEKMIPIGSDFPSEDKFLEINRIFENKLIGFFIFNDGETSINKFLNPFFAGNIILKIDKNEMKAFLIDFDGNKMFFSTIELKTL